MRRCQRVTAFLGLCLLFAGCGSDGPGATAPGPTCDPTITVAPTLVPLASGATATLKATVVPCGLAKKTVWVATDTTIVRVTPTNDTTAVVLGRNVGNTTVVASVLNFPGAHAVAVVQVR